MDFLISITGDLGSGKSTVSKMLAARVGAEIYSTGRIQRAMAESMGMTTKELNVYAETHPEIDYEIDNAVAELGKRTGENIIIDSRMAWHFAPATFSIYLYTESHVAAERVVAAGRTEEKYESVEHAHRELSARRASELQRYRRIYGCDLFDMTNYDLVMDATFVTAERVAEEIYCAWQRYAEGEPTGYGIISPRSIRGTAEGEGRPVVRFENGVFSAVSGYVDTSADFVRPTFKK